MGIVMVFALLVGLSLGLFGGGGAILTVPLLHYALAMPVPEAISASLLLIGATSLFATLQHWRSGQVAWREGSLLGLSGLPGALCGTLFSGLLPDTALLLILATIMLASGLAMLCQRASRPDCQSVPRAPSLLAVSLAGLAIGFMTGLVGAGGGFLVVPALVLLFGLSPHRAIGTAVFVILINSSTGFLAHLGQHAVDPQLVMPLSILAVIGTLAGTRLATGLSATSLRIAFALFVMLASVSVLLHQLTQLPLSWWPDQPAWWWLAAILPGGAGLFFFLTRSCLSRLWRQPFFD